MNAENEDFKMSLLTTIRFIGELALRVDKLFPNGELKVLPKYTKEMMTFTSEEMACLVSIGFFCLYSDPSKSLDMPDPINFILWYEEKGAIMEQKFRFMMNYFELFRQEEISIIEAGQKYRNITVERVSFTKEEVKSFGDDYWTNNESPLSSVNILGDTLIEDMENTLMIDFANRYIGGGVMRKGSVQEEILFMIFPELIACRVICAKMEASEAIVIAGAKRYSKYSGYSSKTKFEGIFEEKQPIDEFGRIDRTFIAIDALRFKGMKFQVEQFYQHDMLRDLNKAYIGFIGDRHETSAKSMKAVTTGRWGCGAYNGNAELKFCIQWIATSANKRNINFSTFGEKDCQNLELIYQNYKDKSIADLFKDLVSLRDFVKESDKGKAMKARKDLN